MIQILNKARHAISSSIFTKPITLRLEYPIISFTFDDIPAITVDYALPILSNYGYKGTFYIAGTFIHNNNLPIKQISLLLEAKHEIGCHTYGHIKTGTCTSKTLQKDLVSNKKLFKKTFSYNSLENFSYPMGSIGLWNKPLLGTRYTSLRSTCPGINFGKIDLNTLFAYKLYSDKMTEETVDRLVRSTVTNKGWLIFYTHDVCPQPTPLGCTPDLLEYTINSARSSQAKILSIKEALKKINK